MEKDFGSLIQLIPNEILKPLNLRTSYLVGGAVRDFLFDIFPLDFDFVVEDTDFKNIQSYFKENNFKFVLFNKENFPLLRVFLNGKTFDFTTYRDIFEDRDRRDFTINAIYVNLEDYYKIVAHENSFYDIEKRILRVVSSDSIKIDPVRFMRAFRFIAQFKLSVVPQTKEIILKDANLYYSSKKERAREELKKFLKYDINTIETTIAKIFDGFSIQDKIRITLAEKVRELYKEINKDITYISILKLFLIARTLPIFAYGLTEKEKTILEFLNKEIKEDFESLFEVYYLNKSKVNLLMLNVIANYPINKIEKMLKILKEFSRVRPSYNDIQEIGKENKLNIDSGAKLAYMRVLREVYENIYNS